jgi:osmoprotectant transport system substrate-binding protein
MEREGDGYEAFKTTYGFDFQRVYPMQVGLVYDALQADEMDIVLGYSTDGRIASYDLVVLEDDMQLFPPYDASPVATKEILEAYPELETILLKLEDTLTDEMMQAMNYEVDNDLVEAQTVAQNFLEENSYFEDKEVTSLKEGE